MTTRMILWLLAACLFACALPATAQFFNLSRVGRPSETTFANGGQPWPYSNATINAINYDVGGQGTAYNVPSPSGSCLQTSSYRPDTVNFNTSTAGPAFVIGCSAPGLSYNYTINLSGTGPYNIGANLSDTSAGGSWGVYLDNVSIGTIATPNTGSFSTFQQALLSASYNATPGNHVLQFRALGGDAAFNGSGDFASFTLIPVTVMSGTASCGNGGPNLVIPAGAAAAGFNTCAVDFDPANGVSCMAGSCVPISPVSNWLDLLNCNDFPTFHQWYVTEDGLSPSSCGNAASQFILTTDGGVNILQLIYLHTTDWNAGIMDAKMATLSPFGNPNPPGTSFPTNFYTETDARIPAPYSNSSPCPSAQVSGGCLTADSWSYSAQGVDKGAEGDFIEIYTNGATGSCFSANYNCGSGGGGVAQPGRLAGFSQTTRHNYGVRQTVDASSNSSLCHYLDGSQITNDPTGAPPCTTATISWPPSTTRVQMIQESGPQGNTAGGNAPAGSPAAQPVADELYNLYRFTLWTCSGWASGPCYTAQHTGNP